MAGKSRRTASRQSQLKRKKTTKGPGGIPAGRRVAVPAKADSAAVPSGTPTGFDEAEFDDLDVLAEAEAAVAPQASRPAPAARTPRGEFAGQGQGRLRGERPAAYLYVGAEFRRIGLLTGVILAALVVLGIVL